MKRKWIAGALALALTATTVFAAAPATASAAGDGENDHGIGFGTTYYVSSENGNDENSGTSEGQAFKTLDKINEITLKPGDRVLLEKGSVFNDQYLHIKGSGTEDQYIEVSTYGEDSERPVINTNGYGQWEQNYGTPLDNTNHKWHGTVSSSILLEDVEYIEIRGLEITNDRVQGAPEGDMEYNDAEAMDRTGVAGVAQNKGTIEHIVLDDLYIHDVDGNVYNKHMANGGIYFIVEKPENEGQTGIARYDDVQIRNCYLDTVNRWGIAVGYTYQWGKFTTAALSDATMATYGSSNVLIENNYLRDVGGDAITTMYLDRPVVQYNVSEGAAKQINTTDYADLQPVLDTTTGEPTGQYQGVGAGRVAAGIWPWKCKNAVFQYNECFNTMNAAHGNGDGQPWDADYGDGTNYQYNYSHGNTASTVMFCGVQSINNTFRYNISQNEDMGPLDPAGNTGNCHVYNNTFYIKEGLTHIWSTMHANNGPVTLENNIFYFAGDTPVNATNWNPSNNKAYDNNLYYNVTNVPGSDENAVNVAAGTEVLAAPGSGPTAAADNGQARLHEDPEETTVFDGYKLAENSPAINAGKVITDQNGFEIEHDFFGHKITATPEIGAAESDVPSVGLGSTVYMTDETDEDNKLIYIPFTDANPTTAGEVIMNVTTDDTAIVSVVEESGDAIGYTDAVAEGMKLRISDGGNNVNEYTIKQKNTYQWAKDYVHRQQGNVWFAQALIGDAWQNMTTVDKDGWPNWALDTYYGPGVDAPQNTTSGYDDDVHGLISTPLKTATAEGTAMAFRAPKSGTVNFSVKDDEPYLRQEGNSGGSVKITLYVNGEEKQSCEMSVSKQKAEFPALNDIEVQQGDWIRAVATNIDSPSKGSVHITPTIEYQDVKADDTTAPRAPRNVDVSDIDKTTATVTWDEAIDNVGVTGYNIYLGDSEEALNGEELVTDRSYKLENLDAGTSYTVSVEAVDAAGNKSDKASADFTTVRDGDVTPPSAPTDLKVGERTDESITVSWKESTDDTEVTGYRVFVDGEEKADVTETECTVEGLEAGTEYTVSVKAYDAEGNESEASEEVTVTTLSDNCSLVDSMYMTDEESLVIYVPFTENNPTTAAELLGNVTVDATAEAGVVTGGDEFGVDWAAGTDKIAENMLLRITAENRDTKDYTILQKNEYSWTMDYAGPQQGNVWFGQMKTGADGAWENIEAYDPTYPNWQVDTYYGPGVDEESHTTPVTDETHGLLSAPPDSDIYTAMAFRAPKTGTVSFEVKDDEPYLRQAGNEGGTVTLSLLVNDEVKQSVILEESQVAAEDWENFDEIEVTAGDYIRVTAKTNENASRPSLHVSPVITYRDVQVEDTDAPTAPGSVTVSDITADSAVVEWEKASDNVAVAGYNIYLGDSETPVNVDQLVMGLTYTLEGLDAATEYTVKVEAVDTSGNKSDTKAEEDFTTLEAEEPDKEAPTKPTDVKVDAKTKDSITISWTASTDNVGVKGYKILVDGMEKANVTEGTTCTITGLEPGTEYKIVVIAYDAMGSQAESDALTVSTLSESGEEPGEEPDKDPEVKPEDKPSKDPAKEEDKAVQTGDAADFSVWAAALLVSAGAVIAVRMRKKES